MNNINELKSSELQWYWSATNDKKMSNYLKSWVYAKKGYNKCNLSSQEGYPEFQ